MYKTVIQLQFLDQISLATLSYFDSRNVILFNDNMNV